MKKIVIIFTFCSLLFTGCMKDLLEQYPPDKIGSDTFWNTVSDAEQAVTGVYEAWRDLFGVVEMQWDPVADLSICGNKGYVIDVIINDAINLKGWLQLVSTQSMAHTKGGSWFRWEIYGAHYLIIHRANNVIAGVDRMLPDAKPVDISQLTRIKAEARFLRAIAYGRLIDLLGPVPIVEHNITREEALEVERAPVTQVRDSIIADYDYAVANLPESYSQYGHATKWAALSFRGKFHLYWASWLKNQRPEWDGITESANTYFALARDDFKTVMDQSGHSLFRNGEPGDYHHPNYQQLFLLPNETNEEIIFSAQYGGPFLVQGNFIKGAFGSRQMGNNGSIEPSIRLVNLYRKLDGSKAPPLIPSTDNTLENGAINPASYEGRDYRLKASVLWDGQKVLLVDAWSPAIAEDSCTFMWGNKGSGSLNDPYFNWNRNKSGYHTRKWMINYAEPYTERYDCGQDFYVMRYADVMLMYCEAVNEVNNGPTGEVETLFNQIRGRGKIAPVPIAGLSKSEFFDLLVDERAVEFFMEGHRFWDIRRWRIVKEAYNFPNGYVTVNTWGDKWADQWVNAQDLHVDRYYTGKIPESERALNPKLTQNPMWL